MIRILILILTLFTLFLGCAQDVPLSRRDLEFARKDLELEREKYKTFAGSREREEVERQIKDFYTDNNKLYLFDEMDSNSSSQGNQNPSVSKDEAARIKQLNELIDRQLHEAQQPVQTEYKVPFK